ncbi:MAG: flagellar export protein FliJ [Desulfococcaceae bacterium]
MQGDWRKEIKPFGVSPSGGSASRRSAFPERPFRPTPVRQARQCKIKKGISCFNSGWRPCFGCGKRKRKNGSTPWRKPWPAGTEDGNGSRSWKRSAAVAANGGYFQRLAREAETVQRDIEAAEADVARRQGRLAEAARDRQILERLRERQRTAHHRAELRRELTQLDELAVLGFGRRRTEEERECKST